mgnify:CR=1 FL=1
MNDTYVKIFSTQSTTGRTIINGRTKVYGIVYYPKDAGSDVDDPETIVLKDGSGGSTLYEVAFPFPKLQKTSGNGFFYQVEFGGDGILFDTEVYFDLGTGPVSAGTDPVKSLLIFYSGGTEA